MALVFAFNYCCGFCFSFQLFNNYWCGFCFCFQLLLWLLFLLSTILVAFVFAFNYCCGSCFCFQLLLWLFVFAFNYCCEFCFFFNYCICFFSTIGSVFWQLLGTPVLSRIVLSQNKKYIPLYHFWEQESIWVLFISFKLRRNANPDVKYKKDFLQKPIDWVVGDLEDVNLHLLRPSQGVMKPKFSCNFNTRHTPLPWMSGERFLASSEPFARVGSRLSATIFDVEVDQSFICTNNSDNRIQQTYN